MKIVVRAPNWIGDSVLAVPAIESLHFNFPEAKLWVASQEWGREFFGAFDYIEGVIPIPAQNKIQSLRHSTQTLKKFEFDIGVLLTNSFASALLFYIAKIPQRWGYNRDGRNLLLTKGITWTETGALVHQAHYYLNLISELGLKVVSPALKLPVNAKDDEEARRLIASVGIKDSNPLVILNPGAHFGPAKRWPAPKFAELAQLLQLRNHADILLVGTPDELELSEVVASLLSKKPYILTGKTSLRQLTALIKQAALFVTNDSGPMHIANALGVPVVALFGPTDPRVTRPFQEPSVVIKKEVPCWPCAYRECPFDHRCMMQIETEEVYKACRAYLS